MKRTGIFAASLMCSVMLSAQTREAAVLFSGTELDESYLLAEEVSVTFDEDGKALISLGVEDKKEFVLDGKNTVTAEFKDAFNLTANQDPNHKENFYSTFYTGLGAYKVPSEATAYIGAIEKSGTDDVLKLNETELIHQSEPVILRASQSNITLMPSCNEDAASTENVLLGTDEGIAEAGSNVYALSLGEKGVGFYPWSGKAIGKNKAYLTLVDNDDNEGGNAKAFTFQFDNGETTAIKEASPKSSPASTELSTGSGKDLYNLNGVRVNDSYKGIVIKNGKKVLKK